MRQHDTGKPEATMDTDSILFTAEGEGTFECAAFPLQAASAAQRTKRSFDVPAETAGKIRAPRTPARAGDCRSAACAHPRTSDLTRVRPDKMDTPKYHGKHPRVLLVEVELVAFCCRRA